MAGLVCLAVAPIPSTAAEPVQLSGAITGLVINSAGSPQMGAAVILYNRQDRAYQKAITDERGEFKFLGLLPDIYSLRVTLANFVPAMKRNIQVQPGMRSALAVNLNSLFSSIQFAYPPVPTGSFMTEDWKWILRTASATRPVLRFTGDALAQPREPAPRGAVFSDTRGVLQLSAGDGPLVTGIGSEADLGTAFALATSLFGNNLLQVSGNLGYGSQTGVPVAAFRTSYSRDRTGGGPVVSVTVRQLFLPDRFSDGASGAALPMLRSVAASFDDRTEISENLSLQYGFTLDSLSFVGHLNSFSPYARLVYSLGNHGDQGELAFAFTSGNARPDLAGGGPQNSELQHSLSTLGLFPRLSLVGGQPRMQRGDEYELSYSRTVGSRVYQLSAYREAVTNAALSLIAPDALFGGDLLPDLFGGDAIFNAGNYQTTGYDAAVTQNLGDRVSATVMWGTMGTLTADRREIANGSPDELRSMIRPGRRQAATARIQATAPWTGTHMIASYQWVGDPRALMPGRLYSTQSVRPLPGFNLYVRQPIPGLSMLPWRVEATADLRNLLAQGYVPLTAANGQPVVLVEMPRSFRGGLSFIF
ncbi:MAG: carboxypeptidase-like regulatory domain-containing protein [Acidobacteriia bacterium]|nr:carboxypeptidase-like regulatory domain-containing protein [Terriglobia bacterium]